jgi:hypothetical protein
LNERGKPIVTIGSPSRTLGGFGERERHVAVPFDMEQGYVVTSQSSAEVVFRSVSPCKAHKACGHALFAEIILPAHPELFVGFAVTARPHDVPVGEDVAIGSDDEAGALAADESALSLDVDDRLAMALGDLMRLEALLMASPKRAAKARLR